MARRRKMTPERREFITGLLVLEPGEINHSESGRNSQLEITGNNHS